MPLPIVCKDATAPSTPLEFTIDAHCHIFNGTDLQVSQFLTRVVNREWKGCEQTSTPLIPEEIMKVVVELLEAAIEDQAPRADEEQRLIQPFIQCNPDPSVRMAILFGELDDRQKKAHAKVQASVLRTKRMKRHLSAKGNKAALSQSGQAVTEESAIAEIHERVKTATPDEYHQMRKSRKEGQTAGSLQAKALDSIDGALDYAYQGFQYRYVSVLTYLKTFPVTPEGTSADLMVAALVDYDWWLAKGKPTLTPLPAQVDLMADISVLTGGRVHALAPFCPLREVASRAHKGKNAWSSLEFVKKAVGKQGCVGIKLYPPMGFAAYGNSEQDPQCWMGEHLPTWVNKPIDYKNGKPPRSFGACLDEALDDLYTWCVAEDVPLMAHTSASNGVSRALMDLAGAKGWAAALKKYPALRISFGHTGDFSDPRACHYPDQSHKFAALLGKAAPDPGFNAYADSSFFSEILDATGRATLSKQFTTFNAKPETPGAAPFYTRMMYGTDWNLLLHLGDIAAYRKDFQELIAKLQVSPGAPPDLAAQFFSGNAIAWLGLKDGCNRKRLEDFYRDRCKLDITKYPPPWLQGIRRA